MMEGTEDDDDLQLVKASAGLLADLEATLPRILWKSRKTSGYHNRPHTRVKQQDLDHVLKLIEPFQSEPQLLDAKLKSILPPIVEAYVQYIELSQPIVAEGFLDFESAVCILLYTICKVRGYKVVLGFLNNEPRFLEPILLRLESTLADDDKGLRTWQVPYVLLRWLSHLLLTPFDLASISGAGTKNGSALQMLTLPHGLPSIAERLLLAGLAYLSVATNAQDAAAMLLVRLVTRPDMRKLEVAEAVVHHALGSLDSNPSEHTSNIYEKIGPLRFLAAVCSTSELAHLIPTIYQTCEQVAQNDESPILSNSVAKKLVVKIFRNTVVLSLRSASAFSASRDFSDADSVLEDVIDYLLQQLGDRDTPVRYAAAKALGLIILQLEPSMGHEVIQAILDSFQQDMPDIYNASGFKAADPLRWHGLTLALAHTLMKRSAATSQLSDIVKVLVSALQFEQRTVTGGSIGTNVRDAANFGIWALSRRYTTNELLSVKVTGIIRTEKDNDQHSVIRLLAVQLILAACLDSAGNIRRGSSAALQELIGRHPDTVHEGIALVQIVDYQAVGLRARAMVTVANQAATLHESYWLALSDAMFGWRALGSPDVPSREAAAASLAQLSLLRFNVDDVPLTRVVRSLRSTSPTDVDDLHGLVLTLANMTHNMILAGDNGRDGFIVEYSSQPDVKEWATILEVLQAATNSFSVRVIRSELPCATVQLLAALCTLLLEVALKDEPTLQTIMTSIERLTERMLDRTETTILRVLPTLVQPLLLWKRNKGLALGCIDPDTLSDTVSGYALNHPSRGYGSVIALGALAPLYYNGIKGDKTAELFYVLGRRVQDAGTVEMRAVGIQALQVAMKSVLDISTTDTRTLSLITQAIYEALTNYTVDERGDVGSLVRLQGISCAATLFETYRNLETPHGLYGKVFLKAQEGEIMRLSLEKLDRVRLSAAQCRHTHLHLATQPTDVAKVSSHAYFVSALQPLASNDAPTWKQESVLEGIMSCAGAGAESVLQASRSALVETLRKVSVSRLHEIMTLCSALLKKMLDRAALFTTYSNNIHAALELLAFLLDMQIPQRLATPGDIQGEEGPPFKWRSLLSNVQKSHHKSNDVPKILAAVHVYRGLAEISAIRGEVLKKLVSMLRTNPYPRVRVSVAEALFVATDDETALQLKGRDWTRPPSQNASLVADLERKLLKDVQ